MSSFAQDINWRPDHYFAKYWKENADPYVAKLPGTAAGLPLEWLLLVLAVVYFIRVWGPSYMESRDAVDVRVWTLPLNGFVFGGYITAIMIMMVPTNFYMDCFDCRAYSPASLKYRHTTIKHFAYVTIYAQLFNFLIPVFFVLAKKQPGITNLHLLYLIATSLGSVVVVKIHPGGISIFPAIMDGLSSIVLYSYLTFASASPGFRPSRRWKFCVFITKMLCWSLILAHSAYFLSIRNCGDPAIKLGLVIFSILVLVLYPYDWFKTHVSTQRRTLILAKNKQLNSFLQQQVLQTTQTSQTSTQDNIMH